MSNFLKTMKEIDLKELISCAEKTIYISLPNIFEGLAISLTEAKKLGKNVYIVINTSEDSFRNGYGDVNAVELLRKSNIAIYEFSGNMISFIICDDTGYFIFPESRIFAYEELGTNAVKIDPLTQSFLIQHFFPLANGETRQEQQRFKEDIIKLKTYVKEITNDIKEHKNKFEIKPLDANRFEEVKKRLEFNPPIHPDLQRKINTYTTKIQFVEMTFEGSNLHIAKVKIPSSAMPFKDKQIKKTLEAKMRIFDDLESKKEFNEFFKVKDEVEVLRKQYCIPIKSRKKSIIQTDKKQEYLSKVKKLKKEIDQLNQKILQYLDKEILTSKDRMKKELSTFIKNNPPEQIKNYEPDILQRKIEDILSGIFSKIKYPEPDKLLKKMSLNVHFYDLTFEDLKKDEFLKDLEKNNVIKQGAIKDIVSFRTAFEEKVSK
ncbi:Uncharacterized protein dnl_06350 [Desulfonema limicola]|uniref:Uncharacterized protein n=1 Tax=Desulfonema limicola TaxID=45656 RepID=A0A975B451_9BACT|nr:hypothetical protein [Desulfonema limicola]QTA78414.1 Uncharacterized protein dnl_06350 [Desulfonema limicola]